MLTLEQCRHRRNADVGEMPTLDRSQLQRYANIGKMPKLKKGHCENANIDEFSREANVGVMWMAE